MSVLERTSLSPSSLALTEISWSDTDEGSCTFSLFEDLAIESLNEGPVCSLNSSVTSGTE